MNFLNFELKALVPQGFQRGKGGEIDVFLRRKLEEFFQKMLPVSWFLIRQYEDITEIYIFYSRLDLKLRGHFSVVLIGEHK